MRDFENLVKYIGFDENWEKVEFVIIEVVVEKNLLIVVEYGEVVFYGLKFDFMV